MGVKKQLIELERGEYRFLVDLGVLKDLYPEATGVYEKDILEFKKPDLLPDSLRLLNELTSVCIKYINYIWSDDYHEDNDYKHFIFEAAMEAIYGDGIFNKINKKVQQNELSNM